MRRLLLVCLSIAACGDGGEASRATASIRVLGGLTPAAGVRVHFQAADSTLVLSTTTDANGVAASFVEPDGSVSVIDPFPTEEPDAAQLYTIVGVQPGDELVLHSPSGISSAREMQLELPTIQNATFYDVRTPCVQATVAASGTRVPFVGCADRLDFVIIPYSMADNPLGWLCHSDQPIVENGTIDWSGDTYDPITMVTHTIVNAPPGAGLIVNGLVLPSGVVALDMKGSVTNTIVMPGLPAFPGAIPLRTTAISTMATAVSIREWGALSSPIDGSPAASAGSLVFDRDASTLVGRDEANLVDAAIIVQDVPRRWRILAPARDGVAQVPRLTGEASEFFPTADAVVNVSGNVVSTTAPYDALRSHWAIDDPTYVAGTSGLSVIWKQ